MFIINSNENISDLGEKLSQTVFTDKAREGLMCDFVVMWYYNHSRKKISVSLRSDSSRDSSTNVREIAELFGGGGHRCAAGFSVETTDNIIDILTNTKSTTHPTTFGRYCSYVRSTICDYWWVVPVMGLFFACGKLNN